MKRHTFREFGVKRHAPNLRFDDELAGWAFVDHENRRAGHREPREPSLPCEEQLAAAEALIENEFGPVAGVDRPSGPSIRG
jgi:hypothetical protein